jgi:hypothetical protein
MKKDILVKSIKNVTSFTFLWLFITSTAPWIFFRWPGHPYKILTFFCLFYFSGMLLIKIKKIKFYKSLVNILLIQASFYFVMVVYHNDFANVTLIIQLISLLIAVTYISIFLNMEFFVKSYIYVILITGIGGALAFFIHLFIGITPIFRVEYGNDVSYFLGLTTTNVFIDIGSLRMLRFAGFFDEPGTFGLYSLFAIILNKIYFNNKKIEIVLILVTCLTLSVAFYFSIFLYLFLFYFNKNNWSFFVLFFLITGLTYLILQYFDNPIIELINKLTFSRVEEVSGDFAGSNRGDLMVNDYSVFVNNPVLGAGYSSPQILGSNFFSIFARYGLLGSFFYYFMLLYLLYVIVKLNDFYYLKFFVVILAVLLHRPEIASILTSLLLYSLIYFIENKLNSNNKLISRNNDIS